MNLRFSALTAAEVRAASFGAVKVPLTRSPNSWKEAEGTLFDPRTFGPERDWECACRRYVGEKHRHMICDVCGVKVAADAAELRLRRFGPINLFSAVEHPLVPGERMVVLPVLPISWRLGAHVEDLNRLYVNLVQTNTAFASHAHEEVSRLEHAVAALVMNERLSEALTERGRP